MSEFRTARTDVPADIIEFMKSFDKELNKTLDFKDQEHRKLYANWLLYTGSLFFKDYGIIKEI